MSRGSSELVMLLWLLLFQFTAVLYYDHDRCYCHLPVSLRGS